MSALGTSGVIEAACCRSFVTELLYILTRHVPPSSSPRPVDVMMFHNWLFSFRYKGLAAMVHKAFSCRLYVDQCWILSRRHVPNPAPPTSASSCSFSAFISKTPARRWILSVPIADMPSASGLERESITVSPARICRFDKARKLEGHAKRMVCPDVAHSVVRMDKFPIVKPLISCSSTGNCSSSSTARIAAIVSRCNKITKWLKYLRAKSSSARTCPTSLSGSITTASALTNSLFSKHAVATDSDNGKAWLPAGSTKFKVNRTRPSWTGIWPIKAVMSRAKSATENSRPRSATEANQLL
mmetsp:Transcript_112833/g.319098  ORF Transcript_112833/g.319098 Transcript_112833/m.319098 type:complete len:299 (-) Transcript_112833:625-1521(-)